MKVVDLFCGCGGMGLGFQQAGLEIVYACDIDKYAVQSYQHNVGKHGVVADITKLTAAELPKADVWTFGFPCQDLSVAGKQAGMEVGTRSGLFYEVMRLLDETDEKPSVLLAENVKGLKKYIPTLEREFNARGYEMSIQLYNSKYWSVPQNRERYYIVGYKNKIDLPLENKVALTKLKDILEDGVPKKYFIDRIITQTITSSKDIIVAGMLDMLGKDQIRRVHDPEGISPTATAVQGGHHHVKIIDNLSVRRLTPREYARLQGFPDSYEIVISDTQAYKQFGNSVTVPLVKEIAMAIKAVLLSEQSAPEKETEKI